MENFKALLTNKKLNIKRGENYAVKRTVMGECVLIQPENVPNTITSEGLLGFYGVLTGTPYIEGVGNVG